MRSAAVLAIALVALVVAVSAPAARAPTPAERAGVLAALPGFVARAPHRCLTVAVRVSNDGRYALATPRFSTATACVKYAGNGFFVLRLTTRWKVVFQGSEGPPCKLRIPRDLIVCMR